MPAGGANWNPISGCVLLSAMPWMKQHKITLLKLVADMEDADSTGVIPTKYTVTQADRIDFNVCATGGGVAAALKNERWEHDQTATIYTDKDPGDFGIHDAFLLLKNVFVIEGIEPIGLVPVAWKIHGERIQYPEEGVKELEVQMLRYTNDEPPDAEFTTPADVQGDA